MIFTYGKFEVFLCLLFLIVGLTKLNAQCDRQSMVTAYRTHFLGTQVSNADLGWSGNLDSCLAGTISDLAMNRSLQRINYYRSLVGLSTQVEFDTSLTDRCQEAALIMHKNNDLDHFPDTTWACWTEGGRKAASKSNLALGAHSSNAIALYMDDPGSNNWAVGHRRWILYSRAKAFGMGSTNRAQSLWVIHNKIPTPEELEYIAYPSSGFFPAPLVSDRWSLSVPGGKFSNAAVRMTDKKGDSIDLLIHPIKNGFGDNTLVWEPARGSIKTFEDEDIMYNVAVKNIIKGADTMDISYQVILAQPVHPPNCGSNKFWSESECLCKEAITTQVLEFSDLKTVIYPNPVRDNLSIYFREITHTKVVKIQLLNVQGIIVKEIHPAIRQNIHVNVSNLPMGVYQCQIKGDGWSQTHKVIILK